MGWQENALCRGHQRPELWFADSPGSRREAHEVCAACPVKRPCLEGALERKEQFGIWGGRDFGQRERHKKYRAAVALREKRQVA